MTTRTSTIRLILCVLALFVLSVHSQYTNVIFVGVANTNGAYGANKIVTTCKILPSNVRTNYPNCVNGSPLAGLRAGDLTEFSNRLAPGSVVGPTGALIASTVEQFYTQPLDRSLRDANVSCTTFYSMASANTGLVPDAGMNHGCALGLADFLGSDSALRSFWRGDCTSTTAGSWYSMATTAACSTTTSLLCTCSSLNTPTASPTLPTPLPTSGPTKSPVFTPTTSPTLPTGSPSKAPTKTPSHGPTRSPVVPTPEPPFPNTTSPSHAPTFSPTLAPTYPQAITNVIYNLGDTEDLDYGASDYTRDCATIPNNINRNFPSCSAGIPLASLRRNGVTVHFNSRMDSGNVVGPNGFVIADNVTQFYTSALRMTLSAAEVDCSHFFSGTMPTGLANTGKSECAKSTTGDFLADDDKNSLFRRGSCTSSAVSWFSPGTAKCDSSTSFLCFCRVFVTSSPTLLPSTAPTPPTPHTKSPTTASPSNTPSRSPTVTTSSPTLRPTTLTPTRRPSTLAPTFQQAEVNVLYLGASSVKGDYGAYNFVGTCNNIPDAVLEAFPLCQAGSPLASLRTSGVVTQFASRITSGIVYGANGRLIAETPEQFYGNATLNSSLSAAGVPCTTFYSGTQTNLLAYSSQCTSSSSGDFLTSDKDDYTWRVGSCLSTEETWFSTSNVKCDKSASLVCYCQVFVTNTPTVPPTPAMNSSSEQLNSDGVDESTVAAAWGLVGGLAAIVVLGGVGLVFYRRSSKPSLARGQPTALNQRTSIGSTELVPVNERDI